MRTNNKKFKCFYLTTILSAIMLVLFSASFSSKTPIYADDASNDQGYVRTITVAKDIPLYTTDGGADILSCFGYACNRSLNFVNADYTSSADDGKTFVYNCTGASTIPA